MVSSTTLLVDIHDIKSIERLNDERTVHCILKTICLRNNFIIVSTNIQLSPTNINLQIKTETCNIIINTNPSQRHASFYLHTFDYTENDSLFEIYEFLTLAFDAPYKSEYITIMNTFAPDELIPDAKLSPLQSQLDSVQS
jgi:hypothetical protein